ncbi:hypothetical protein AC1031_001500 [Aphanomyces cochlioides]|nr:hypothetical protein AC1031_001500 [Aphanomyces cochlioides]
MAVLLAWITYRNSKGEYTNWLRYKGAVKTKTGVPKKTVGKEISSLLARYGFLRDVGAVLDKVQRIHASFIKANDWEHQTGQELRENARDYCTDKTSAESIEIMVQSEKPIKEAMLKICEFYDDLYPVFGNRPLAAPIYHSSSDDGTRDLSSDLFGTDTNEDAELDVSLQTQTSIDIPKGALKSKFDDIVPAASTKKRIRLLGDKKHKSFGKSIAEALSNTARMQKEIANDYIESKKWEATTKRDELAVLKRKEKHNEIIQEARLMSEIGVPRDDVLEYIRQEKAKLEED